MEFALVIALLVVSVTCVYAEQSSLESKNFIDLNGFSYSVMQIFDTERLGFNELPSVPILNKS